MLPIVEYPDSRLAQKSQDVEEIDDSILQLIDEMFETMYALDGAGLAAIQVGHAKNIFVMDCGDGPLCFINPQLTLLGGEIIDKEGCLSFPDIILNIKRAQHVKVNALDRNGTSFEVEYNGDLSARCVQHEVDHLRGITFFDHLKSLKRQMVEKKYAKLHKQAKK